MSPATLFIIPDTVIAGHPTHHVDYAQLVIVCKDENAQGRRAVRSTGHEPFLFECLAYLAIGKLGFPPPQE
jgi:hypothetical protein